MKKEEQKKRLIKKLHTTGAIGTFLDIMESDPVTVRRLFAEYSCAAMEVETKFRVLSEQFSVTYDANPIDYIRTRIKTYDSIVRKMVRKGYPLTLESLQKNLYDVAGVRVICSFESDIYRLKDMFLRQDDVKLIEEKDYIQNPKESGYRSLHLIVQVPIFLSDAKKEVTAEVQLRTAAMDFWATMEHKLQYNKDLSEKAVAAVSDELRECADIAADLDRRIEIARRKIERVQGMEGKERR